MINTNKKIILTFLSTFIILLAGGHGIISLPLAFIYYINDSNNTNIPNLFFILSYLLGSLFLISTLFSKYNLKKSLFLAGILFYSLSIVIVLFKSDAPFITFLTSIPFILLARSTHKHLSFNSDKDK
jgi:hypothetical protein